MATVRVVGELTGDGVALRPMAERDAAELTAILSSPEVAAWWGALPDGFPFEDEPDSTRFTIVVDGGVAGLIQYGEEPEPDYRHATVDIFLDPELHNRGLGTDAIITLVRHLVDERGHHRVTIDPATDNASAIRCYEKAGFSPVGVMHSAWRDPSGTWRDVLLMELVVR